MFKKHSTLIIVALVIAAAAAGYYFLVRPHMGHTAAYETSCPSCH